MSVKLSLNPSPTFTAPVEIPLPDGVVAKQVFTFKHRTREQLNELLANKEITDPDLIAAMCTGWDLDEEFSSDNIKLLCSNYMMAPRLILNVYTASLIEGRKGN